MEEEVVVLVDVHDNEVGTAPKLQAHREGRLHRAISVFVFNRSGEMLLQRRAGGKYHSGGLWSNTCCTHPRPGENPHRAAKRRLAEEMGIACELSESFAFIYRAEVEPDLVEHELDYVYVGITADNPEPDPTEVDGWRWATPEQVTRELLETPQRFTAWFPIAFTELERRLEEGGKAGKRGPASEPDREGAQRG